MTVSARDVPRLDLNDDPQCCAAWIAKMLKARGIDRIFGLQGGHIQPIWDYAAQEGIRIIDVRDERAAVHMAHAHAELTGGFGVAMVTAGPGVTNTVTSMANASLARVPVLLIGGCTSRPQANMGPLQDIPHVDILKPVCRYSRTARVADQVIREMDEAIARAFGDMGEPGPAYIEIPTDVLRTHVQPQLVLDEWMAGTPQRKLQPAPDAVQQAADAIRNAKRPLVITGRGARGASKELVRFLDAVDALYLDTQESRGLVPSDHPAFAGAVRGAVMGQSDLVIVLGRKLDYQTAYGSPAVYGDARFIRISDTAGELIDNRRGSARNCWLMWALRWTPSPMHLAMTPAKRDTAWLEGLRAKQKERTAKGDAAKAPQTGAGWQDPPAGHFRRHQGARGQGLHRHCRWRRPAELCPHRA
jgi:acetolactate synthase-1/2/3 large subunit